MFLEDAFLFFLEFHSICQCLWMIQRIIAAVCLVLWRNGGMLYISMGTFSSMVCSMAKCMRLYAAQLLLFAQGAQTMDANVLKENISI